MITLKMGGFPCRQAPNQTVGIRSLFSGAIVQRDDIVLKNNPTKTNAPHKDILQLNFYCRLFVFVVVFVVCFFLKILKTSN